MNMSARIALAGAVSIVLVACGPRMPGNTGGGSGGNGGSSSAGGSGATGGGSGATGGGSGTAGGTVLTCAQSCAGCCSAGACQPGNTTAACGRQGATCAACTGSQTCNAQSECIDTTCAGCVAAGACVAAGSQTNTQCGSGGISCIDCSANGGTCDAGSCAGGTCAGCRDQQGRCQPGSTNGACGSAGAACAACGTGTVCRNGACEMIGGTGGGSGAGGGSGTAGGTGGTAGGSTVDAGQAFNAKRRNFGDLVQLRGVVVTAIDSQFVGGQGDGQSSFWVAEPSNPTVGLYIFKNFTDTIDGVTDGGISVGDIVNIDGYLATAFPNLGAIAYRYELKNKTTGSPPELRVVVTGHVAAALPDTTVTGPFGNMGTGRPQGLVPSDQQRMAFDQARVQIPGPLTLSNPAPVELIRSNDTADGTVFGFEVTGAAIPAGVLVRNNRTFRLSDGGSSAGDGTPACDYRQMVADGGRMVSFPNGIRGVWTTFSQSPCFNGQPSCTGAGTIRDAGSVPGLNVPYTWVLQPVDCTDLAGAVVTP